jgi:hypothetical protein
MMALGTFAAASAAAEPFQAKAVENQVELRSGSDHTYYVVGKLDQGERVKVEEVYFGWHKVHPPEDVHSFIARGHVDAKGDGSVGVVTKTGAKVLAANTRGPGLSYAVQKRLKKGDKVQILGMAGDEDEQQDDYYKIKPPKGAYVFAPPESLERVETASGPAVADAGAESAESESASADGGIDASGEGNETNEGGDTPGGGDDSVAQVAQASGGAAAPDGADEPSGGESGGDGGAAEADDAGSGSTTGAAEDAADAQDRGQAQGGDSESAGGSTASGEGQSEPEPDSGSGQASQSAQADQSGQSSESGQTDPSASSEAGQQPGGQANLDAGKGAPAPTESQARSAALKKLEAKMLPKFRKPLTKQPVKKMIAKYKAIQETDLPAYDQRLIKIRLGALERNRELKQTLSEIEQVQQASQKPPQTQPERETLDPMDYDVIGRLAASSVYDGQNLPRLFRLVDFTSGYTIGYVEPDDVNARQMLGEIIGIVGTKRRDPSMNVHVFNIERVDVLEKPVNTQ